MPSTYGLVLNRSIIETNNVLRKYTYSQQTFVRLETSSRHVLKTSSTRLQRNNFTSSKTSWRRLEDVFEDEKLFRWRRLEDVLKTYLQDVFKTYLEDVLKTLWRETKYLPGISVSNKSKCVSSKSIFDKSISDNSKVNPKCIN